MREFQVASQTIGQALKTGQIGTPVAVRIVAHLSADHGTVERLSASALEAASTWLQSQPTELTASGSAERGQVSTLARFAGGQTALVSAGSSGVGSPLLEILVFGNRGVLSWEGTGARSKFDRKGEVRNRSDRRQSAPRPKALSPPYGVLLVAGDHTHQPGYAADLAADKRCKLIGLTDEADVTPRRKRLNRQLAVRLGIPLLPNLREALSRDDVHIVSICAEPRRRGRIIVQAAEAGKHLYLDKPLAGSLREADEIVKAVHKANVVSHMMSLANQDIVARISQVVDSGQLGDLAAVHFDLCFAKGQAGTAKLGTPRRETPIPKRFELIDAKRELSNVGVYPLVTLLCLWDRKIKSVSATTGNYFFQEHQQQNLEDFGQMLLELDGGLTATISAGRTGWRSSRGGGLNRTYLIGTEQTAVVDANRPRVEVWADVEPWTAPEHDPADPMGMWGGPRDKKFTPRPRRDWISPSGPAGPSDVSYFLDCVEQGRQSSVSATVAAAATEALMAAYQSAATGKTVPLPLPRG